MTSVFLQSCLLKQRAWFERKYKISERFHASPTMCPLWQWVKETTRESKPAALGISSSLKFHCSVALFKVWEVRLKQVRANMPTAASNWILPIKPHCRHENHRPMSPTVVRKHLSQWREELGRLQRRLCMAVRGVYISDYLYTNQAPCGTVAHHW